VASEAECEAALQSLVDAISTLEPDVRRKYVVDRTVSVRVADLDVTWAARLTEEGVIGLSTDAPKAQVRLTVGSDDLLALVNGKLAVPTAVATGRIRVQASPFDLLRLSAFL
jgi:predicted lipid carrier protein YhbT